MGSIGGAAHQQPRLVEGITTPRQIVEMTIEALYRPAVDAEKREPEEWAASEGKR